MSNPFVQAHFLEEPSGDPLFTVGTRVQTRYNQGQGNQTWWHGTVTELNSQGTRCRILYDDGSSETADLPDDDIHLEQAWSIFLLSEIDLADAPA